MIESKTLTKTIRSVRKMQAYANEARRKNYKIAFVPTMGALHDGHLKLISEGKKQGDILVISIFVNPAQFGPKEDFQKYKRDLEGDLKKIDTLGVDVVFVPSIEEIYPQGFQTYVEVVELQKPLCGKCRPGHFKGVVTIILKLFNIVKPHIALFGEKDYQQLKIIQKMVEDLNLEVDIRSIPIVRDKYGVALSSRNKYLSDKEKTSARKIIRTLHEIKGKFSKGMKDTTTIIDIGRKILNKDNSINIDYLEIRDPLTLQCKDKAKNGDLLAVAVRIGNARLIDNIRL